MKKVLSTLIGSSLLAAIATVGFVGEAAAKGGPPSSAGGGNSGGGNSGGSGGLTLKLGSSTCSTNDLTMSTACEGAYDGNPSNTIDSNTELFGKTGWTQIAKVDSPADSNDTLTLTYDEVADNSKSGDWQYNGSLDYDSYHYMIALKGGPTFSTYLLGFDTTSGSWNTDGILTGGQNPNPGPGLSNFTIYKADGATPVPEPFTILGSAVALGVGALAKKKYGQKQA